MPPLVEFFVPGVPRPKGSMRAVRILDRSGQAVVKLTSDNRKLSSWAQTVRDYARVAGLRVRRPVTEGPVSVELCFLMPMPKRLRRETVMVKPDLDKLVRGVLDALSGVAYRDDAQVVSIKAMKVYAREPGVEIRLSDFA